MPEQAVQRTTLSVKETSALLGVSTKLVYQLVREKNIPFVRIAGRILFKVDSIDRWLSKQEEENVREA